MRVLFVGYYTKIPNESFHFFIWDDQKLCVECLGLQEHTILKSDDMLEDTQKEIDKGTPCYYVIDTIKGFFLCIIIKDI